MNETFKLHIEDSEIPSLPELEEHFTVNFHIVNGRLVLNTTQPIIVDYITSL